MAGKAEPPQPLLSASEFFSASPMASGLMPDSRKATELI
jgi:hypothetical protein